MTNRLMPAAALAACLVFAASATMSRAEQSPSKLDDPGFVPNTGQINPGVPQQPPSASDDDIQVPTPQESRAALRMPISKQPSAGDSSGAMPALQPMTTGAADPNAGNAEPPPFGPIGSFGQTLPAKFSARNDTLDRTPIMAWPLPLSDEQEKQIFQAVMADKSPAAPGADMLKPSSALTAEQALDGMHDLPESVANIGAVKGLKFVKAKDKVLLVRPATRVVVGQIAS